MPILGLKRMPLFFSPNKEYSTYFSTTFQAEVFANLLYMYHDWDKATTILNDNLNEFLKNNNDINNFDIKKCLISIPDEIKQSLSTQGGIIVSFHTSNFFLVPFLISTHINRKVNVLIAHTNKKHIEHYSRWSDIARDRGFKSEINYITTETQRNFYSLVKCLKNKEVVLIYVDEIVSIGDADSNMTWVNFLDTEIKTRNGAGYLSYKFNVPIYVISSSRSKGCNVINYAIQLQPTKIDFEENFISFNTKIFSVLSDLLLKNPGCWLKWDTFHRLRKIEGNGNHEKIDTFAISNNNSIFKLDDCKLFFWNHLNHVFCTTVGDMKTIPLNEEILNCMFLLVKYRSVKEIGQKIESLDPPNRKAAINIVNTLFYKDCFVYGN